MEIIIFIAGLILGFIIHIKSSKKTIVVPGIVYRHKIKKDFKVKVINIFLSSVSFTTNDYECFAMDIDDFAKEFEVD